MGQIQECKLTLTDTVWLESKFLSGHAKIFMVFEGLSVREEFRGVVDLRLGVGAESYSELQRVIRIV